MIQTGALTVNLPLPRKIREKLQVSQEGPVTESSAYGAVYATNKNINTPPMYEATAAQRNYNSNMPHSATTTFIGPGRSNAHPFGPSLLNPESLASRSDGTTHACSSLQYMQHNNYHSEPSKVNIPPVVFNPAMHSSRLTSPMATERSYASSMRADLMPVISPNNTPKHTLYFASHQDPVDLTAGCSFVLIEEVTGNIIAKHAFVVCQYYCKSLQPDCEALSAGLLECIRRKLTGPLRVRTCSTTLHMQLNNTRSESNTLFPSSFYISDPLLEKARKMLTQLQVTPATVELYTPYDLHEVTELAVQAYDYHLRSSQTTTLPTFTSTPITANTTTNTTNTSVVGAFGAPYTKQQQQQQPYQQQGRAVGAGGGGGVSYSNGNAFDFTSFATAVDQISLPSPPSYTTHLHHSQSQSLYSNNSNNNNSMSGSSMSILASRTFTSNGIQSS